MKKLVFYIVVIAAVALSLSAKPIQDCKCKKGDGKEIPLHGRVRVVDSHADFTVRVVDSHADLHVKKVQSHPNNCGEWRFVDSHADFTIRFVSSHADFTVRFVESFPGQQR